MAGYTCECHHVWRMQATWTNNSFTACSVDSHELLSKTYPFYLAFENSLCDDYVSERFFSSLHTDMIPVVMNGANMSQIAPKHSYIDLKDFASIKGDDKNKVNCIN